MESDRIFCNKCGAENEKSSKFCEKCGAALYYVSQPSKPSVAWYLLPIILGAVFLGWLGGIIGYIVLRVKDEKMAKNVLYVGIGTLVIGIILVILVAMVPSPPPVDTGVPISTPTPVAVTPTPTPTQYPWKSILIREGRAPAGISGNILEVNVDLDRQLSSNEFKSLSEKVTLIDENGREYHPLVRSASRGAGIIVREHYDPEDEFLRWAAAEFAYGFLFEVESESSSYTLSWPDYPPLEVGNPFQSVFCLGCIEEETPASTPTTIVTPTPTLTATPVSPTAKASATSTRANVGESLSISGADSTDPDGTITSYEWDFDDGTTASGATVAHAYSNEGTYTVKLTVTDNSGLSDTDTIKITVTTPRYTLNEAIDNDFVKAEITGNGASSGDSLNLKLTRKTSNSIEITVPKGTVMHASGGAQDMVVWKLRGIPEGTQWIIPVSKIVLDSSEPQTFILEAYCLDFHKDNPSSSTRFSVGVLTDPQILKILNAVDCLSSDITSVAAIQTAIWVVTEDVSKNELLNRFPVTQNDINNAQIVLEEVGIDTASKRLFQ